MRMKRLNESERIHLGETISMKSGVIAAAFIGSRMDE